MSSFWLKKKVIYPLVLTGDQREINHFGGSLRLKGLSGGRSLIARILEPRKAPEGPKPNRRSSTEGPKSAKQKEVNHFPGFLMLQTHSELQFGDLQVGYKKGLERPQARKSCREATYTLVGPFHIQHHTTKVTVSYRRQPACSFWFFNGCPWYGEMEPKPNASWQVCLHVWRRTPSFSFSIKGCPGGPGPGGLGFSSKPNQPTSQPTNGCRWKAS